MAKARPETAIRITLNGEPRALEGGDAPPTIARLIHEAGLEGQRVAVELNGDVIPRAEHGTRLLCDGDRIEMVTFVGGGEVAGEDPLVLGTHVFQSRLFVGTGKYATNEQMNEALAASGTECVTVALRRVDLARKGGPNVLDALGDRYVLLPNTAGCFTADDAVRTCRLARELALSDLVKLEVLADPETLLPDPFETSKALKVLVAEGFTVLVYTNDDPVTARRLEQEGAAAVMPLGSPIGSGLGILNPRNIETILRARRCRSSWTRAWARPTSPSPWGSASRRAAPTRASPARDPCGWPRRCVTRTAGRNASRRPHAGDPEREQPDPGHDPGAAVARA
jgi:thiazole synthase